MTPQERQEKKTAYENWLRKKIKPIEYHGFDIEKKDIHPSLFPHARDIVQWAVKGGRRAIFASPGLMKTSMQIETLRQIQLREGGKVLVVCPLGVKHEFQLVDGQRIGVDIRYVRTNAEVSECESNFLITNYERVRDGGIDPNQFVAVSLDEAAVLASFGSLTYQTFLPLFANVKYKFVATATPARNKYKELIHYAGYLGIQDTGASLTQFFQRNSEKANDLTLYPHMVEKFWMWIASWAVFVDKPSDLGYDDTGFNLPKIDIKYHIVPSDITKPKFDSWGQGQLVHDATLSLKDAAEEKQDTIKVRLNKTIEIINSENPNKHWIIWHSLEPERKAIEKAIPEARTVYGTQEMEKREELLIGFTNGDYRIMATKAKLAGYGCNFQKHCSDAIVMGIDYKFVDLLQLICRIYRYLQQNDVTIHIILTEAETNIMQVVKEKWQRHIDMIEIMRAIVKKYGLTDQAIHGQVRSFGVERKEFKSKLFISAHNDSVHETIDMDSNSVGLILSSIPFGNQYEYAPSFNDFGYNPDNEEFFEQMGFLIPELLRVLEPGRISAIHVKDRILFGNVTGLGMPTVGRFSDKTADAFEKYGLFKYKCCSCQYESTNEFDFIKVSSEFLKAMWSEMPKDKFISELFSDKIREHKCKKCSQIVHMEKTKIDGFVTIGRITVVTDVVRENNQTYRLGWTENSKDGTKMGCGMSEYVMLFRKLPTDTSNAYADTPVTKSKEEYIRAQWQIDAHSLWRSSGNRLMTAEEISNWPVKKIIDWWKKYNSTHIYNYEEHVNLGVDLEKNERLPSSFMLFAPTSHDEMVWHDVSRMHTLNSSQMRRNLANHCCPMQFDTVDRLITRYSMPGELVYDPFFGIGTTVYRAIKLGRRGRGSELNEEYWRAGNGYCRAAEEKLNAPTFFDDLEINEGDLIEPQIEIPTNGNAQLVHD